MKKETTLQYTQCYKQTGFLFFNFQDISSLHKSHNFWTPKPLQKVGLKLLFSPLVLILKTIINLFLQREFTIKITDMNEFNIIYNNTYIKSF